MGTNSTGSKSVRKNRRVRKSAKPTPIGMIGVKVEVVEATHDLLKRLAYDVDSQFTGDEIENLARAFFEVIDRGPGFGPEFIGEIREQLVEAVEQSAGGNVVVPLRVMQQLAGTLDRLADHKGHLSEPLVRACEDRLRRNEFDDAVAAALAARATPPRPEDIAPDLLPGGKVRCFFIVAGGRCAGLDGHDGDHYSDARVLAAPIPCECHGGVEVR